MDFSNGLFRWARFVSSGTLSAQIFLKRTVVFLVFQLWKVGNISFNKKIEDTLLMIGLMFKINKMFLLSMFILRKPKLFIYEKCLNNLISCFLYFYTDAECSGTKSRIRITCKVQAVPKWVTWFKLRIFLLLFYLQASYFTQTHKSWSSFI